MKNLKADTYKAIVITLAIFIFFGGLIAGGLSSSNGKDINFGVTILVWFFDITFALLSLLLSDILKVLENMYSNNKQ